MGEIKENNQEQSLHIKPESTSNYPHLKKIKRRTFLTWLGGVAAGATLATLPEPLKAQEPTDGEDRLKRLFDDENSQEEPEEETIIPYFALQLIVDANGFPKAYQIKDGPRVELGPVQLHRLRQAQEQARINKEVEPGLQLFIPIENFSKQPSERSPFITEAPKDLLSKEQLSDIGVTVVNPTGDSFASKLYIRESSVSEEGLLEPLQLLNKGKSDDQKFKLDIVTLNAPFIANEFFSKNPS